MSKKRMRLIYFNNLIYFPMKTNPIATALILLLFAFSSFAQDKTIVTSSNSEISDNLDLRAIASLFGDARNLEEFERLLNDPKNQISNLDLNNDNNVDYLRVIESVEENTHLVIVQSVLSRDTFQDVATIEVEKDSNNQVQVQVVGDVYMYGQNYIYEPVYINSPVIYSTFWTPIYHPYVSVWYWDYYPTYYYTWNPFPIFRYRNNINIFINHNNHYNYVSVRRSTRAYALHKSIRANYCERQYPDRSFAVRNASFSNRHELEKTRTVNNGGTRNVATRNVITRNNATKTDNTRNQVKNGSKRNVTSVKSNNTTRNNSNTSTKSKPVQENNTTKNNSYSNTSTKNKPVQENSSTKNNSYSNTRTNSNPVQKNTINKNNSYSNTEKKLVRENSGSSGNQSEKVKPINNISDNSNNQSDGNANNRNSR